MTNWNWDEPLTPEFASKCRTKWESLDLAQAEKRLHRLYDLRNFAGLCGAEVPQSWRKLLAEEIDRGERRYAELVFRNEPPVDPDAIEPAPTPQCDVTNENDLPESLFAETFDEK